MPSYRVIGRKEVRQNLRGIEGMRSPLFGRERELNSLHEILDRTEQGLGHIVCLTGDAGLGTSCLIEEVVRSLILSDIVISEEKLIEGELRQVYGILLKRREFHNQVGLAMESFYIEDVCWSIWPVSTKH